MDIESENKLSLIQQINVVIRKVNTENAKKLYRSKRCRRYFKNFLLLVVAFHLIGIVFNSLLLNAQFRDDDEDRGAIAVKNDLFNESFSTPTYLEQGWNEKQSLWFYKTTQGSNLIPYDFYVVLKQVDNDLLFNSQENIRKFRYLTQRKRKFNPDGLPVGFVKDTYQNHEYLGFTCAACHTSQINYKDKITEEYKAIRIDGGPSQSDMVGFMKALSDSLKSTIENDAKKKEFVEDVLARNTVGKIFTLSGRNYTSEEQVLTDLVKVSKKIEFFNWVNRSKTAYGFSRLDAFGRIYNRVLEHVVDRDLLENILRNILENKNELETLMIKIDKRSADSTHLVAETIDLLSEVEKERLYNELFNSADAPVSYPYLWDVPYHDYLQWNGVVSNAGPGALGRNVGQVIGVFGNLDWKKDSSFSFSKLLHESKSTVDSVSYHSSINVRNLYRTENLIKELKSPKWPDSELVSIDYKKAKLGQKHFESYCESCHHSIVRDDKKRRITAQITSLENVGTDPKTAKNSVNHSGYTGLLQGSHVTTSVGNFLLQEKSPVSLMVHTTTEKTLKTPDLDTHFLARWSNWIYDLLLTYADNPVKETIKQGTYNPDTTSEPFASLLSYKARPLNGIWATAPYLHNGSVPTLYDLLLPKKRIGDPITAEYRPDTFQVGSREFDSKKVGFKSKGYEGFTFDTNLSGNSNSGHEYAAGRTKMPNGETLPALNPRERDELLEYLKTL